VKATLQFVLLVLVTTFASPWATAEGSKGTVLITGANRGIGLELANQFAAAGFTVIGTARKPAEADELKALGARVEPLDVTEKDSVAALAASLRDTPIDLLINNAGISGQPPEDIEKLDVDAMAWTFNVNSLGPMRVTQALLPNLRAGKGKRIVQMSSVMGSIANNSGGYYDYRASKAALNMLNVSLSKELGPQGFTCVALHPGWVKTRMGGPSAPMAVKDSAAGLLAVMTALTPDNNGQFMDYQGNQLPW
jgi:NAD(P)-dependent dehydrogenase (short-subunit alcohol dehydrogenase family)